MIDGVCKRLQANLFISKHCVVLKEIGQIYRHFHASPDKLSPEYLSLTEKLKEILNTEKDLIESEDANFEEIDNFLKTHEFYKIVVESFSMTHLAIAKKKLEKMRQDFITSHQEISKMMIRILDSNEKW